MFTNRALRNAQFGVASKTIFQGIREERPSKVCSGHLFQHNVALFHYLIWYTCVLPIVCHVKLEVVNSLFSQIILRLVQKDIWISATIAELIYQLMLSKIRLIVLQRYLIPWFLQIFYKYNDEIYCQLYKFDMSRRKKPHSHGYKRLI